MIPPFEPSGRLPPGIHWADREELNTRFGFNTHRKRLLGGFFRAAHALQIAGCPVVYVDGSFVTNKEFPSDYDGCWSTIGVEPRRHDPVLLDFSNARAAQKLKYFGELFPMDIQAAIDGSVFLDFFQTDKETGDRKGIIALALMQF